MDQDSKKEIQAAVELTMAMLLQEGIKSAVCMYSGFGDSGNGTNIVVKRLNGEVIPTPDRVLELLDEITEQVISAYSLEGYQDGEGGGGELVFNVQENKVTLEHYYNEVERHYTNYTLLGEANQGVTSDQSEIMVPLTSKQKEFAYILVQQNIPFHWNGHYFVVQRTSKEVVEDYMRQAENSVLIRWTTEDVQDALKESDDPDEPLDDAQAIAILNLVKANGEAIRLYELIADTYTANKETIEAMKGTAG